MLTHDHIQQASNTKIAQMVEEIARRHVDIDKEILLVAARRLRIKPKEVFNHEAFE